jgi:hypothetical protein
MDGIAESSMEIVRLPPTGKVRVDDDSDPSTVELKTDREAPINSGSVLPSRLERGLVNWIA